MLDPSPLLADLLGERIALGTDGGAHRGGLAAVGYALGPGMTAGSGANADLLRGPADLVVLFASDADGYTHTRAVVTYFVAPELRETAMALLADETPG